jgi:hypothetical protein
LAAVQDIFGMEDKDVFKSASRLAGGVEISARGRAWHKMPRGGGVAGGGKKPINERRCIKERKF